MNYRELFSSINCKCIVIIEDDFKQSPYKKERALYDIARMALEDRNQYLTEIEKISTSLKVILTEFLSLLDECFEKIGSWDDNIPFGDISYAFALIEKINPVLNAQIKYKYDCFEGVDIQNIYENGAKYGIGVDHPSYFDELFNDYVLHKNRACSLRVYTDFSAETQQLFVETIESASPNAAVVCIIDNYLGETNRAEEIIGVVSAMCKAERKNIVGTIFSSKEVYEKISDALYFEYTPKETPGLLKSCIAKSAYNFFISELKKETLVSMSDAFDKAMNNKGIAFFLAQKARKEGTSEYEIINDWIKLLATIPHEDSSAVKRMIRLSKVINSLEETDEMPGPDIQKLNTIEAFDYTINDYFLPVAAGDIFTNDNGEWFVLIGQDCDMARREKKGPNNALAELLPAKVRRQADFDKWANDLKNASIYSFRKTFNAESEVFQVEYQHRRYISNEILNLCSFNVDGQCKISLSERLNSEIEQLMPTHMADYYLKLQQFFVAIKTLRTQAGEAFETVIAEEYSPRLLSFKDFTMTSDTVLFDLRRVCRLTHDYVFYLYKLYLEYRGRQPFQTINLIRQEDTTLPVFLNKKETGQYLSFRGIPIPDKSNRKSWCWIVDALELNRILELLQLPLLLKSDQDVILKDDCTELSLALGKKVRIQKAKEKVYFVSQ